MFKKYQHVERFGTDEVEGIVWHLAFCDREDKAGKAGVVSMIKLFKLWVSLKLGDWALEQDYIGTEMRLLQRLKGEKTMWYQRAAFEHAILGFKIAVFGGNK